jgi:hypothetical protein
MSQHKLRGTVLDWNLGDPTIKGEQYFVTNINYGLLREIAKPYLFSAVDGTGEQRAQKKARIRQLRNAISKGEYTPAAWYMGVRDDHDVEFDNDKVVVNVDSSYPLPLTDANHRRAALEELRADGGIMQRKIDNLPITCIVHLNPNKTKLNFINLNDKFNVDAGQMLTMKISNGAVKSNQKEFYSLALDIARLLHTASNSHLYRLIKFDTQSGGSLPFKSISQSGKSDLSTSLYGMAMICKDYGKDAEWGANQILFAYETLLSDAPELIKKGMVLAPEPDGTMGGSTLIVGLGNMLAYRMKLLGREIPLKADNDQFIKAVREVFTGEVVDGNFSTQRKRMFMGEFTRALFADLVEAEDTLIGAHEGIPIVLCNLLGTSTFNVSKFEKPKGKRGRKPKVVAPVKEEPSEPPAKLDVPVEETTLDVDTDPEWTEDDTPPWSDSDETEEDSEVDF